MDQQREPPFRGPWPVWAVAGLILLSFGLQDHFLDLGDAATRYGVSGQGLSQGRWGGLISALFIHGSWGHAAMNAIGALAFGAPVARRLGLGLQGAAGFLVYYLVCGALANLGYAGVHPHDVIPLVGASGAVSGLFGGASRLMERGAFRPAPLLSTPVVTSAAAWIAVNVALGLMHFAPGIGDVQVGWEAHIAGYFAGLFLVTPVLALFAPRPAESAPL